MTFNETLKDWLTTFWKTLISPTPKTFLAESQKGEGKYTSAVGWLVFFVIYIFIFSIIAFKQALITGFIFVLVALPFSVVLFTSAIYFIHQQIFQRKQYLYDKLMYITVAILLTDMGCPSDIIINRQQDLKLGYSFISNCFDGNSSQNNYEPQILAGSHHSISFNISRWFDIFVYHPFSS